MFITIILFNLASTLGYIVCITYGTSLHGSNELQFEWWKFSILWIIYGENHNVDIFTLIFVNKIIPRLYDDTGIWIIFCKLFCKERRVFPDTYNWCSYSHIEFYTFTFCDIFRAPKTGQNLWFTYDSVKELDDLINSLHPQGIRENHLKAELKKRYDIVHKAVIRANRWDIELDHTFLCRL